MSDLSRIIDHGKATTKKEIGKNVVFTARSAYDPKRKGYNELCFTFHYHNFFEILYVRRGKLRLYTSSGLKTLKENDIYIVDLNEVHGGLFFEDNEIDYIFLHLNLNELNVQGNSSMQKAIEDIRLGILSPKSYIPAGTPEANEFAKVLEYVWENYWKPYGETERAMMQHAFCFELLAAIYRLNLFTKVKPVNSNKNKVISSQILSYIQEHYKEKISTKTICNEFFYDESQFCRMFKKNFGMSFLDYLNYYRIEKACKYSLRENQISIYEIASEVGFENYSYFYRNFKKYTGTTPMKYFSAEKGGIKEGE